MPLSFSQMGNPPREPWLCVFSPSPLPSADCNCTRFRPSFDQFTSNSLLLIRLTLSPDGPPPPEEQNPLSIRLEPIRV